MAKARAITKRRKSVRNIRKITQTMQLIATTRYQKCYKRAVASKPYTLKITEMMETLSASGSIEHPLLQPNERAPRSILLVITSNRGLCGSYNSGVLRAAAERFLADKAAQRPVGIEMVGKKGVSFMRFLGHTPELAITDIEDRIAYSRVAEMAERYMAMYTRREISRVDVAYMRFVSLGNQKPTVAQLLPIEPPKSEAGVEKRKVDFEFSPALDLLLGRLVPEMVKVRLYQAFNDALLSEQLARMVAMKSATEAAGDMIKYLTRTYNRARQSQITMELLDIIGGAAAVEN